MENVCCNSCGADAARFLFSKWNLNIVECTKCGLCYVNPRNFVVEADDYFRGAYLSTIEESGILSPGISGIYQQILESLSAYISPGRLLDVGCAMGHFMREARRSGWNVSGTECSSYAAEYGRTHHGLEVYAVCGLHEARLPANYFDAVVLIEVAEHLPQPRQTLLEAFRLLKPGGVLYLTTPNFASFRALLQRDKWAAVIPTGHLYYFTAPTMAFMLESIGFTGIKDLTMPALLAPELDSVISGNSLQLNSEQLEQLFLSASREDSDKLTNGRGEGLIIWATKPLGENPGVVAHLRRKGPRPELEGKLICGPGTSAEDQKVYYVHNERKYWVTSVEWLAQHYLQISDTIQVPRATLDTLLTGPPLI